MGKKIDHFLDIMNLTNDDPNSNMMDEDEFEGNGIEEEDTEEIEEKEKKFSFFQRRKHREEEEEETEEIISPKTTKVVSDITESRRPREYNKKPSNIVSIMRGEKVKVVRPQTFGESESIINDFKNNKTIVMNLEEMKDTKMAQRITDVVSGACYALGGTYDYVSNKIFIFAPKGTDISGDLMHENPDKKFISLDMEDYEE